MRPFDSKRRRAVAAQGVTNDFKDKGFSSGLATSRQGEFAERRDERFALLIGQSLLIFIKLRKEPCGRTRNVLNADLDLPERQQSFTASFAHKVHDGGSMYANEPSGIHSFAEIGYRFTQHVAAPAAMQAAVVFGGLHPIDLLDRKKYFLLAILHQKTHCVGLRAFARPEPVPPSLFLKRSHACGEGWSRPL